MNIQWRGRLMELSSYAKLFKCLSDPNRLKLLLLLKEEELCVCELQEVLQMSQPAVSQHLRKLKEEELIVARRQKQWLFYRLNERSEDYPFLYEILQQLPSQKDSITTGLKVKCELIGGRT